MRPSAHSTLEGRLRRWARPCSLAAALIGVVMLIAWRFGFLALLSFSAGGPPMVPNTAAAFVVLGGGLFLRTGRAPGRIGRAVAHACCLAVVAFGMVVLGEYAFGVALDLDRLLLQSPTAGPYPGRPSPPTAIALVLAATAAMLLDVETARGRRPAEWLVSVAGFIAFVALTGHVYGVGRLYRLAGAEVIGVSLPTILCLGLVTAAILAARPDRGAMALVTADTPGGKLARRLGLAAAAIPLGVELFVKLLGRAGLDPALSLALIAASMLPLGLTVVLVMSASIDRAHARFAEEERRLRGRLEDLRRATTDISDAVAALPDAGIEKLLTIVALHARAMTGARYAAIGVGTDPERPFAPWVHEGLSAEEAHALGRPPRPVGLLGRVACRGETIRVRDLRAEAGFRGFPPHHPSMRSFLGVPIWYRGRSVGSLYLADKQGAEEFTAEDQRLVELLASRAGTALETARLYAAEARGHGWLQEVIDQMPEGVIVVEGGRVTSINRAARAFAVASDRNDPLGNPYVFDVRWPSGEAVAWEDLPLVRAIVRREAVAGVELVLARPDGSPVSVLASATPVEEHGPGGGAVVVFQDITALKELERLREQWTSVIAHDLRQPIGVISLAVDLVARSHRGSLRSGETKAIDRIRSAASRLDRMIGDLLEASRIETHQLTLHREPLALPTWVEEVVEHSAHLTGGHRVRVEVCGPIPEIEADPERLEQVLVNLLSNATRYGDAGAPIDVRVEAAGATVAVVVTNRGPGLSPDELARLFTRFYRTRTATARREGLGLGLYICKGIVEAHGGAIEVRSELGVKTSFRVVLPASASPEHADPVGRTTESDAARSESP